MGWIVSSQFYRAGSWDTEKLSNVPEVTQPPSGRVRGQVQALNIHYANSMIYLSHFFTRIAELEVTKETCDSISYSFPCPQGLESLH